jgi:hypothetical protein
VLVSVCYPLQPRLSTVVHKRLRGNNTTSYTYTYDRAGNLATATCGRRSGCAWITGYPEVTLKMEFCPDSRPLARNPDFWVTAACLLSSRAHAGVSQMQVLDAGR